MTILVGTDDGSTRRVRLSLPVVKLEVGVPVGLLGQATTPVRLSRSKSVEDEVETDPDKSLPLRLVQVVEDVHIVVVEFYDLEVVDDPFLGDRFRENDDLTLNCSHGSCQASACLRKSD